MRAACCTGLALALVAQVARAQDSTASIASPTVEPLLRMALALLAIGLAAWAVGVWARRRRIHRTGTDWRIDVLALRSLGPRQRLALVEVAERRLLIGLGPDSIRPIADLTDPLGFDGQLDRQLEGDGNTPELLSAVGRFEGLDG